MQFVGQRTNEALEPIAEIDRWWVKMPPDVLPDPKSILLHGLTPQETLERGISEAELLRHLTETVFTPGTHIIGFNNLRSHDRFIQHALWRNFYDPYAWQHEEGRNCFDLFDVVRLIRALNLEKISWPRDFKGKLRNRLALITKANHLEQPQPPGAASNLQMALRLARFLKRQYGELFNYLLNPNSRGEVLTRLRALTPLLYCSGSYPSDFANTTIVKPLGEHPQRPGYWFVYDLRADPRVLMGMSVAQIAHAWKRPRVKYRPHFPVKTLDWGRTPALVSLAMVNTDQMGRLGMDPPEINQHAQWMHHVTPLFEQVLEAYQSLADEAPPWVVSAQSVDAQLYAAPVPALDQALMRQVRLSGGEQLSALQLPFEDPRLQALLPLYKARTYPEHLSPEERQAWQEFRRTRLMAGEESSQIQHYFRQVARGFAFPSELYPHELKLLQQLQSYGEFMQQSF